MDSAINKGLIDYRILNGKNAIINGDMRIAQRGTSLTGIASGDSPYTLDRWQIGVVNSAAVVTVSQETDVPTEQGFYNSLQIAVTTEDASVAANDRVWFRQWIEGFNSNRLLGKTCTFSFWLKSNKTGVMSIRFSDKVGTRSYVSDITIADTEWNKYSITFVMDDSSGTWGHTNDSGMQVMWSLMGGSDTTTSNTDVWQNASYISSTSADNFMDSTSNTILITGVQLELGNTVTEFEFLNYSAQLQQCQRYYEKSYHLNISPGTASTFNGCAIFRSGVGGQGWQEGLRCDFKVTKRTNPTVVWYSVNTGNAGYVYKNSVGDQAVTINQYAGMTSTGWPNLYVSISDLCLAHWVADAEL